MVASEKARHEAAVFERKVREREMRHKRTPKEEVREEKAMEARAQGAGNHYAMSLLVCMTGSLAMGGQGLGTCGCTPEVAEQMAKEAGFSRFRVHEGGLPGQKEVKQRLYIAQP